MASVRARGFTLIELLTVIAIIAILAALTAVAVPRVLQKARLTSAENAMNQMGTIFAAYFADHGSYPPGYGYERFDGLSLWLTPWNAILGLYEGADHIDPYAEETHDTNQDNQLGLLEFLPVGTQLGPNNLAYPDVVYNPFGAIPAVIQSEINRQLDTDRPYVYVPVNLNDFRKVSAYYNNASAGDFVARQRAAVWDSSNQALQSIMGNRPAKYDAFVLISVGPNVNTAGVVPEYLSDTGSGNPYYMTGLRAYFLATRDANDNGSLDFDWRSRMRGEDSSADAYREGGIAPFADQLVLTPNGTGAPGPLIFHRQ